MYLIGNALEYRLKRRVAQTLGFSGGFPETGPEFTAYNRQVAHFNAISTGIQLRKLQEIRNQDLGLLANYSGIESRILLGASNEWMDVRSWNPEFRYRIRRFTKDRAFHFMNAATVILKIIK